MESMAVAVGGGWNAILARASGIIERARRRQRRRRAAVCLLALAAVAAALIVRAAADGPGASVGSGRPSTFVAPSALLDPRHPPYMGVACTTPNSIACDRVGLAIWLRRPAVAVHATIAGRPLTLARMPGRGAFTGYLHPAGIVGHLHVRPEGGRHSWYGGRFPPPPLVSLRVRYRDGRVVTTRLRVDLNTGWG